MSKGLGALQRRAIDVLRNHAEQTERNDAWCELQMAIFFMVNLPEFQEKSTGIYHLVDRQGDDTFNRLHWNGQPTKSEYIAAYRALRQLAKRQLVEFGTRPRGTMWGTLARRPIVQVRLSVNSGSGVNT